MNQIFPDMLAERENYMTKLGQTLDYVYPKISEDTILFGKGN